MCVGNNGVVMESHVEKETFRRHPPSHFVFSHATTEKPRWVGIHLPKDARVEFLHDVVIWDHRVEDDVVRCRD